MVVLMSRWPRTSCAMWGGMPLRMASVVKILRKSCGMKVSGLPSAPAMPAVASVMVRMSRMLPMGIGRFSRPTGRWKSRGMGGFQVRSCVS